nr:O-antigen ligase family protein [Aquibacillus albus]
MHSIIYHHSIITIILSVGIIAFYYNGNLIEAVLNTGIYFYPEKNSFSPLLLVSLIYIIYRLFYYRFNIYSLIFLFIGAISLIVIQSRTAILSFLVSGLLLLLIKMNRIWNSLIGIIINLSMFCLIIVFTAYSEWFNNLISLLFRFDYIQYANYSNFTDNLTSGRLISIKVAYENFMKNPLFGTSFRVEHIINDPISKAGVHNMWLRTLFYGGIFYFIILILFIFLLLKNYTVNLKYNHLIYALLVGALIMSLGEPFAPFGPGTSYFLLWLVMGLLLQVKNLRKQSSLVEKVL